MQHPARPFPRGRGQLLDAALGGGAHRGLDAATGGGDVGVRVAGGPLRVLGAALTQPRDVGVRIDEAGQHRAASRIHLHGVGR